MQLIHLPIRKEDGFYQLEPYFGTLVYSKKTRGVSEFSKKLISAKFCCDNPYNLVSPLADIYKTEFCEMDKVSEQISRRLIQLTKLNFWLAIRYASFGRQNCTNAIQAIRLFRRLYPSSIQEELCLPRAVFAARMSQRFKESGVIFIGVFLPTRSMHAWVIEDNIQPDENDTIWTNFNPVAAIC